MDNSLQSFLEMPVIQAPMAGVTTPQFAAACSNAGALGSIGAGYLSAKALTEAIQQMKQLTSRPFQVNLFVPEHQEASELQLQRAKQALQQIAETLGTPQWTASWSCPDLEGQIQAVIDGQVPVCSFTFGIPEQHLIDRLKQHGVFLIGTATTAEEARLIEQAGMDAVVLQGIEAGGHRGSFTDGENLPLETLLAETKDHVQIPIIAAGGIAAREHIEYFLANGAAAVQIGTALLASDESSANPFYKQALLQAKEHSTVLTTAFSGKPARGIENTFMIQMKNASIAPYPFQNDLTKALRAAALTAGQPEYMSLWAGENVHLIQQGTVAELLQSLYRK